MLANLLCKCSAQQCCTHYILSSTVHLYCWTLEHAIETKLPVTKLKLCVFQGEKWNSWAWRLDKPDQHLPQPALLSRRSLTGLWRSKTLKYTTNSERNIFSILKLLHFRKILKIGFCLEIFINSLNTNKLIKILWYSFFIYYLWMYDDCYNYHCPKKYQQIRQRKILF